MKNNIGINNRGVHLESVNDKKKAVKKNGIKRRNKIGRKEIKLCGYLSTRYKLINFIFIFLLLRVFCCFRSVELYNRI